MTKNSTHGPEVSKQCGSENPPATRVRAKRKLTEARFVVVPYVTPGGSPSFRVRGFNRDGTRVREQFSSLEAARARANELESLFIGVDAGAALRLTRLTPLALGIAESVMLRLSEPKELKLAVDYWLRFGRQQVGEGKIPNLAEAVKDFGEWLRSEDCDLRKYTVNGYISALDRFHAAAGDVSLAALTPDVIDHVLRTRWGKHPTSRHSLRRVISRFCSWCMQRPRRWLASNPASGKVIETKPGYAMRESEPEVYTLRQVMRLLAAARRYRKGKFLRLIVLSLFAGLRPTEALRVRPDQANLDERELRIEAAQSKIGRSRTVQLPEVAVAWLEICPKGKTVTWPNNRIHWVEFKRMAKITHWPHDGLRHTAISYYFRASGSYGFTAEWAGNSENVIKAHYQGRVTRSDSELYWTLYPDRTERRQAREQLARKVQKEQEQAKVLRVFLPDPALVPAQPSRSAVV